MEVKRHGGGYPNYYIEEKGKPIAGPFRTRESAEKFLEKMIAAEIAEGTRDEIRDNVRKFGHA